MKCHKFRNSLTTTFRMSLKINLLFLLYDYYSPISFEEWNYFQTNEYFILFYRSIVFHHWKMIKLIHIWIMHWWYLKHFQQFLLTHWPNKWSIILKGYFIQCVSVFFLSNNKNFLNVPTLKVNVWLLLFFFGKFTHNPFGIGSLNIM